MGKSVFWFMVLIFLTVSTICLVNAVGWIGRHFPGFLLNERVVVAPVGQYYWSGVKAGLKYPDKIVSADGQEISSVAALNEVISRTFVGIPILYEIERDGKRLSFSVPTMRFTWLDLVLTFGPAFLAGVAYMLIGVVVFIMKPNIRVSWAFLIACFFLGLWSITIFDIQSTHFGFIRLYIFANCFVPAAFVHFSLLFPEPRKAVKRRPVIQVVPYFIAFAIAFPLEALYPWGPFQLFYSLALFYLIVGALFVVYPVVISYFRPPTILARQRAKVILLGAAIAFPVPALAYFSQLLTGSFLGLRVQTNLLTLPLILFPASIAYAIARHNLFDVDVYIKRAVGYVFMTAIIIGAYALISIPLNIALSEYEISHSRAFPIIFTLIVILVFNPLYQRIQLFVDRVFFRKEYDYRAVIDKVGNAITSMLDLPQILKELVTTFTMDLFIDTSSVMLLTPEGTQFKVFLADGDKREAVEDVKIDRKASVVKIIEDERKELTKYDVLEDPKFQEVSETCSTDFQALNAMLMVPLIYKEKVIGLLNLGEKKSGKFYTREDINLIKTIAGQGAVAIENARMVEEVVEKERMEEELNIARDLQVSMLPASCPKAAGFDIAAVSTPAREVGGDFFDFIEMGEDRIGLLVGDVTGKSVSGALVMSAARSVFRMLSEEKLGVAEIMMRANRRTKKDIKTGMFVALLYAVLDAEERTLTLCSAGQTQPVYFSSQTGEAKLLETEGDTFPLGIIEEADYQETKLNLEVGDKLVFYTDGIVEAMNAQQQIYGFERLVALLRSSGSLDAEALLNEIMKQVNEFVGGAPQSDDLTVIVVSVDGKK